MDEATREAIQQDITNSHDELESARILYREHKYRQALSRAYYAIFYAATAILTTKHIRRAKHSGVQSAFGQFLVKPHLIEEEYGSIYARVREARELSDYERGFVPLAEFTLAKIEDTEKFVARIEKYLVDAEK